MVELNLNAKGTEQEIILAYLKDNASETLAEKINNGTPVEKDGKTLINKKTLDGFMTYACEEVRKQTEKGARGACIQDSTVFGWAVHYFEEDSIEEKLYNPDGTEYKPPKPKYEPKTVSKTAESVKPQLKQQTLFDLMQAAEQEPETPVETEETITPAEETDEDDEPSEEEMREIFKQLAEEETRQQETQPESPKGSPMYRKYTELQSKYPDTVIAQRIGDFYEILGENAVTVSEELGLTLIGRDCGLSERIPMVGFPYHAADKYIAKISENHKLAVVETLGSERTIETSKSLNISEPPKPNAPSKKHWINETTYADDDGIVYETVQPETLRKLNELLEDKIIAR